MRDLTPQDLEEALAAYCAASAEEAQSLARIRRFLAGPEDPFSRATAEGHVTGSAVVARPDGSAFLLVLHRKLSRWLQPGGHTEESDPSVFDTALREAREETGIARFEMPLGECVFDVDVHPIPAHKSDPAHSHFDIRYLLTSDERAHAEHAEDPDRPMRWVSMDAARALGLDPSLDRALRKAQTMLRSVPPSPSPSVPAGEEVLPRPLPPAGGEGWGEGGEDPREQRLVHGVVEKP